MQKLSLFLLLLFWQAIVFAQNAPFDTTLWSYLTQMSNPPSQSQQTYIEADSVYKAGVALKDSQKVAIAQYFRGSILLLAQQYQAAREDIGASLQYAKANGFSKAIRADMAYILSECNMMLSNFRQGRELMQESLTLSDDSIARAETLIGWGVLLHRLGEREAAMDTLMFSLTELKKYPNKNDKVAQCYTNLAAMCQEVDDERTEYFAEEAIKRIELHYGRQPNALSGPVNYTLGMWQLKNRNYNAAIESFQKAIQAWTAMSRTEVSPPVANCYSMIARAKNYQGDVLTALSLVKKAIQLRSSTPLDDSDPTIFYTEAAEYLAKMNQLEAAWMYSDTADMLLQKIKSENASDFIINKLALHVSTSRIGLSISQWEVEHNPEVLKKALLNIPQVTKLFEQIQNDVFEKKTDDASIIELANDAYKSIEPLIELYYLADSLKLDTEGVSKAYQLAESIKALGLLRKQLIETSNMNLPEFYYSFEVADVLNRLITRKNDALLQYFAGTKQVYIFLLTSNSLTLKRTPNGANLEVCMEDFLEGIQGYYTLDKAKKTEGKPEEYNRRYLNSGFPLYQLLVGPVAIHIPDNARLAIIPDHRLGTLPFEALLQSDRNTHVDELDFSQLDYFIGNKTIYYGWSARSLYQMTFSNENGSKCTELKTFSAFTPFSKTEDSKKEGLPHTAKVADIATQLFDGIKTWNDAPKATVSDFKLEAPCSKYLYVGSHGTARNQRNGSYIYFNPVNSNSSNADPLTIDKIFGLNFRQTDHVMLEACSSGNGLLRPGDGIISLAWAFVAAGAKSVSSNLWAVNAYTSGEMSKIFYQEVAQNPDAAAALATAKRNMIARKDDQIINYPHPYYWSATVITGGSTP